MKTLKSILLKFSLLTLFTFSSFSFFAQHKTIILNNFYKQNFLKYSGKNSFETFYPVNETQLNLSDSLKDTSILYYDFFVWFFKKNWIEIKEDNARLEISPLINLSYGKGFNVTDSLPLYRNSRGVYATGEFSNKVSYSFMFCENQSRFMNYESQYFLDRGEFYDNDSVFQKVNAVIPAGARTKPFKVNGFDYAFSIGSIAYQATKKMRFEFGNNQHFIGSGYRSLLLSDNSVYAPAIRFSWNLSDKLSYQILYRKHRNLFRKPATLAVEPAYETKFFAANYFTFKATNNFAISIFSAGNQLRTDSITKNPIQVQMLTPLPFLNTDLFQNSNLINGISGLNLDLGFEKVRFYGQISLDKYEKTFLLAYQVGAYYFDVLKLKNLNFQMEFNHVPNQFYASSNQKLAYSQYNLPLAHVKGNNFTEIYANINYNFKRFYLNNSFLVYFTPSGTQTQQIESNSIFQTNKALATFTKGETFVNTLEAGFRINKKYNPTLFVQFQIRKNQFTAQGFKSEYNNMIMAGLKVNLFNQYLDF